jgi:beta-glucanase (GH16 family)
MWSNRLETIVSKLSGILFFLLLATPALAEPPEGWNWKLIWSDEFDGKELDMSKWVYRLGQRRGGVWVKEALSLDGKGCLVMRAYAKNGVNYASGIYTPGLFSHRYGYYEIRCQFPKNQGHWMSFWLQSPTLGLPPYEPGPTGTEVDIFEYDCVGTDHLSHNIHWGDYYDNHEHSGYVSDVPGLQKGFHTVGLLWTQNEYVIYVDGKETWRTSYGISNQKLYINITDEIFDGLPEGYLVKDDMLMVDYVRVYDIPDTLVPEFKKDGKFVQIIELTTSEKGESLLKADLRKNLMQVLNLPETTVRHLPLVEVAEDKQVEARFQSNGVTDEVLVTLKPWEVKDRGVCGYIFNPLQVDTIRVIGEDKGVSGKKVSLTRYGRELTSRLYVQPDSWYILSNIPTDGNMRTIKLYRLLIHNSKPAATQPAK